MKWPFSVQCCAAFWVLFVGMCVLATRHWAVIPIVLNLSVPAFVIGRQTAIDAMKRAREEDG